jgi:MFS family permease
MLGGAFLTAAFMDNGTPLPVMLVIFALAGIGWATINVNSFPMVVELAKGGNVGKYTGFYYTASMAAQTVTPYISGLFMDNLGMKTLFPYATVFVGLALITMILVRHGDAIPVKAQSATDYIPDAD